MSDNTSPSDKQPEPNKTICNKCMSEITGIEDLESTSALFPHGLDENEEDENDSFNVDDVLDHMASCLLMTHEKIENGEKMMANINIGYVMADINLLRNFFGVDIECTCGDHEDDEE